MITRTRKRAQRANLLQLLYNSSILEQCFVFLSEKEIFTLTSFVCVHWKTVSFSSSQWKLIAKEKWSHWWKSAYGKFPFCFREGHSENDILHKERELGCKLRIDIRELLKEYYLDFPYTVAHHDPDEHTKMPTNLSPLGEWKPFDPICMERFGVSPEELFANNSRRSCHKYLDIGYDELDIILLDLTTWEVIVLSWIWNDDVRVKSKGTFIEWFSRGTSMLDVTKDNLREFQGLSDRKHASLICSLAVDLVGYSPVETSEEMEFMQKFIKTFICDSSLLCRHYIDELIYHEDEMPPTLEEERAEEEELLSLKSVRRHKENVINLLRGLMEDLSQNEESRELKLLREFVVFPQP
mmetsp:Transcript_33158/g.43671  ORF Transcript_33158/g.43671 Transcript_33158/m.43671 type:complete len:353 (+) Transcript_33158:88-1146(+)